MKINIEIEEKDSIVFLTALGGLLSPIHQPAVHSENAQLARIVDELGSNTQRLLIEFDERLARLENSAEQAVDEETAEWAKETLSAMTPPEPAPQATPEFHPTDDDCVLADGSARECPPATEGPPESPEPAQSAPKQAEPTIAATSPVEAPKTEAQTAEPGKKVRRPKTAAQLEQAKLNIAKGRATLAAKRAAAKAASESPVESPTESPVAPSLQLLSTAEQIAHEAIASGHSQPASNGRDQSQIPLRNRALPAKPKAGAFHEVISAEECGNGYYDTPSPVPAARFARSK